MKLTSKVNGQAGTGSNMVFLVSPHEGAARWVIEQGISIDEQTHYLDLAKIRKGDAVIGSGLPIHIIAALCEKGARYYHINVGKMPSELRGRSLTSDEMKACETALVQYHIETVKEKESGST